MQQTGAKDVQDSAGLGEMIHWELYKRFKNGVENVPSREASIVYIHSGKSEFLSEQHNIMNFQF